MIKMIKQINDEVLYWEVWEDNNTLVIHYGSVGDTGVTKERKLLTTQKAEKVLSELASEKAKEGYDYLDDDELIELVIQFSYDENDIESALIKRHTIEDLMNECLGWTGNGSCDGGEIGSGTATVFNYVLDEEKALLTIKEELINNDFLEGVQILYLDLESDTHIALYPGDAKLLLM